MKVILIDDNPQFRESIEMYLKLKLGYEVLHCFESADEFLSSDTGHNADIILMDIEMPGTNGIEATKKALWTNNNLKVIAVTNYQAKAYLTELIHAGFKGCVFKNDIFSDLDKALQTVINKGMFFPKNIQVE